MQFLSKFPLRGWNSLSSTFKPLLCDIWKDWGWSWNFNTLDTWWEELTYWKRPRCWGRLKVGVEGEDRGLDGWMASPTRWAWVWVNSGSWWWTGKPGVLQSMESQRVGHYQASELNWLTLNDYLLINNKKLKIVWIHLMLIVLLLLHNFLLYML